MKVIDDVLDFSKVFELEVLTDDKDGITGCEITRPYTRAPIANVVKALSQ